MISKDVAWGVAILSIACVLWGASFPVIKVVTNFIDVYTYLWVRSSIALLALAPFLARAIANRKVCKECVVGGLATGLAYVAGLGLQAMGTHLTEASRAAFITGFCTVFVHLYSSLVERRYSKELGFALALSILGLYLMTEPQGGLSVGDALVLLSAIAWAAQVVLVSRYSACDPLAFVFFENVPAVAIALPIDYAASDWVNGMNIESLALLAFLGIACSVAAFALQVVGQKLVDPATAVIIYQTEPIYAAAIAHVTIGETLAGLEGLGASLIFIATILAALGSTKLSLTRVEPKALRK